MWWRREPALDWATVDGIIRKLMDIDEQLERIIRALDLEEDDDEEEMDA
jgi:hypothetical protein